MKRIPVWLLNKGFSFLREISNYSLNFGSEKEKKLLRKLLKKEPKSSFILDVGCGFGRNLKLLSSMGFQVLGIDKNPEIIKENKLQGLKSINVSDFHFKKEKNDIVLMAHIIEHFGPPDLFEFLEKYLDTLILNGKLIILTPLFTKMFFVDFDHIKPYSPLGIQMFFSGNPEQVKDSSRNKLKLLKVKYVKIPHSHRTISVKTQTASILQKGVIDLLFLNLFFFSFGAIGKNAGWIGVFQKIENKND